MRHMIGTGAGSRVLRQAIDAAWRSGPRTVTVNTCTADHLAGCRTISGPGSAVAHGAGDLDVPIFLGMRIRTICGLKPPAAGLPAVLIRGQKPIW